MLTYLYTFTYNTCLLNFLHFFITTVTFTTTSNSFVVYLCALLIYVVAGPRILEHMVDTVIFMTGEEQEQLRIVRTIKNRSDKYLFIHIIEHSIILNVYIFTTPISFLKQIWTHL